MASQAVVLIAPAKRSARGLAADDHGNRQYSDHEVGVDLEQDPPRVGPRLFIRRVRGVTLLPQEFGGTQEDPRPELPSDDVRPLVEQQGKIAIAVYPLRHELPDNRLGRRSDDDRLVERLAARMRHDGKLRAEALDVLCFPVEV